MRITEEITNLSPRITVNAHLEPQFMDGLCHTADSVGKLRWLWNQAASSRISMIFDTPAVINIDILIASFLERKLAKKMLDKVRLAYGQA